MNKPLPNRQSIRLKGYDYSKEGLYFITLVCQNRLPLFGKIDNGVMLLNDAGKMIELEWLKLKSRFPNIELHEFVVMPDHFHGIVEITDAVSNVTKLKVISRYPSWIPVKGRHKAKTGIHKGLPKPPHKALP